VRKKDGLDNVTKVKKKKKKKKKKKMQLTIMELFVHEHYQESFLE